MDQVNATLVLLFCSDIYPRRALAFSYTPPFASVQAFSFDTRGFSLASESVSYQLTRLFSKLVSPPSGLSNGRQIWPDN